MTVGAPGRTTDAGLLTPGTGPHSGQPVATWGSDFGNARGVMILLHGRGGSGADMLDLAPLIATAGFAALAPEAHGQTWYPGRFTAPVWQNEPYLGSALSIVAGLIEAAATQGMPRERIALVGFSQGGCLALETAARQADSLGAVIGLSAGLIGETINPAIYARHHGMPVLLGCSERDPHIPLVRVRETESVFSSLGAEVETRIYPGSGHGINQEEVDKARRLIMELGTR
jgi:phospholipase/carboxylesterase